MKTKHLKKTEEFKEIFTGGRKIRGKTLVLYLKKDEKGKSPTVGVVVTKKLAPLAVQRNYVKRAIYAFFEKHAETLDPGILAVVRMAADLKGVSRKKVRDMITADLREHFLRDVKK